MLWIVSCTSPLQPKPNRDNNRLNLQHQRSKPFSSAVLTATCCSCKLSTSNARAGSQIYTNIHTNIHTFLCICMYFGMHNQSQTQQHICKLSFVQQYIETTLRRIVDNSKQCFYPSEAQQFKNTHLKHGTTLGVFFCDIETPGRSEHLKSEDSLIGAHDNINIHIHSEILILNIKY